MIQINTKDGKTHNFDVTEKSKQDEFNNLVDDPGFAAKITGVGVHHRGAHQMFPIPKDMPVKNYFAEPLIEKTKDGAITLTGERLLVYVDGLRVTLTVWYQKKGPRVTTFEIKNVGRQMFRPPIQSEKTDDEEIEIEIEKEL